MRNKSKVVFDICLNIGAAGMPIAILQLFVYPYLAKTISSDQYGLMITMYSVWIVVSNSLGNVLNNIRLLKVNIYEELGINGDFPVFLRHMLIINLFVIFSGTVFYTEYFDGLSIFLSILISSLILLKAYLEVGFRINLNFGAILINGILQSLGFVVGVLVFQIVHIWQFVFLFGFLFNTLFTAYKTGILKEKYVKTQMYKTVKRDINLYTVATFSGNLMSYADKMILYPLMGGHIVSVYYTATILGKIVSMISGPVTGVILSYISKWKDRKKGVFSKVLIIGIVLSIAGYIITMFISYPVISLLFPQWLKEVMVYLPITSLAIVIQTLNSFLNPFVLKFYDIKWQIIISVCSAFIYFFMALSLWYCLGMVGFCIGTVCGQLSKTIIMIFLNAYYKRSKS